MIIRKLGGGIVVLALLFGCEDSVTETSTSSATGGAGGGTGGNAGGMGGGGGGGSPVDVCEALAPGALAWAWPASDLGLIVQSDVAGGRMSVISVNDAGDSMLHVLDAGSGALVEEFALTGANAPDRPLIDFPAGGQVGTAAFASRDEQGRTYILHTPSSGDETSIPTMVYRYEADGTKAYGASLTNAVHTSLLIEHDGNGGAVIEVYREPAQGRFLAHIDSGGSPDWEYTIPVVPLLGGFVIDDDHLWVTGRREEPQAGLVPWIGQVSLQTGVATGVEAFIDGFGASFAPERIALAPGGDMYVLGRETSEGARSVLRINATGTVVWQASVGVTDFWQGEWIMDLDALENGSGLCASVPEPPGTSAREESIFCLADDGEVLLQLGSHATGGSEGGVDVDAQGNIHAKVMDDWYRLKMFCSPFDG